MLKWRTLIGCAGSDVIYPFDVPGDSCDPHLMLLFDACYYPAVSFFPEPAEDYFI